MHFLCISFIWRKCEIHRKVSFSGSQNISNIIHNPVGSGYHKSCLLSAPLLCNAPTRYCDAIDRNRILHRPRVICKRSSAFSDCDITSQPGSSICTLDWRSSLTRTDRNHNCHVIATDSLHLPPPIMICRSDMDRWLARSNGSCALFL